jgi:hypothetical protein
MAGFALHTLFRNVLLMAEQNITNRFGKRLHIIVACVAVIARFVHFLFVARLTLRVGRQNSVGGEYTRRGFMTLRTFGTRLGMFGVGEFDELSFIRNTTDIGNGASAAEQHESDYADNCSQY